MMGEHHELIHLKSLDNGSHDIIKLKEGRHVIGRGPFLGCTDKRVSRNHGIIEVGVDGTVELESTHINPCFHQKQGDDNYIAISKNSKVLLEVGDRFSLLPSSCSYEVLLIHLQHDQCEKSKTPKVDETIVDDTQCNDHINNEAISSSVDNDKRVLPQWLLDLAKSKKTTNVTEESEPGTSTKMKVSAKVKGTSKAGTSKAGISQNSKENDNDMSDDDEDKIKPPVKKTKVKTTTVVNKTAPTTTKRNKCPYGATCYRKNPAHFEEECHPGDEDYVSGDEVDSDEDDDQRPECEYGLKCYRKNPQHRKDFKHTTDPRPVRNAAKKAKAKTRAMGDDDDADSFIADDDSEYSFESTDSEDVDELVKEAEKFKRNKKLLKPTS